MDRHFTLAQARALLPQAIDAASDIVDLRADLAETKLAMQHGEPPPAGVIPEMKAVEARLQDRIDWFAQHGIQLKGIAPVIIDFPSQLEGQPTLLCWLEGEAALEWHHPPELGFMGRRRLDI